MKKFNIICAVLMLVMIIGIVYNFLALEFGSSQSPVYHRVMLTLDGILLGMTIGECWMGNAVVTNKCNFDREENK
jgi:hypothetical protein